MNELEAARQDINEIDRQMAGLFVRRMAASERVLEYKRGHGLEIFDAARERQVIEQGLLRVEDEALRPYYRSFIKAVMDISKEYQHELLEGRK